MVTSASQVFTDSVMTPPTTRIARHGTTRYEIYKGKGVITLIKLLIGARFIWWTICHQFHQKLHVSTKKPALLALCLLGMPVLNSLSQQIIPRLGVAGLCGIDKATL